MQTDSIQLASAGGNGGFTGEFEDSYLPIAVSYDGSTFNAATSRTSNIRAEAGGPCTKNAQGAVFGCLGPTIEIGGVFSFAQTYGANDANQFGGPGATLLVQITELGNALNILTGTQTVASAIAQDAQQTGNGTNNSPGLALVDCLKNGGPMPDPDDIGL